MVDRIAQLVVLGTGTSLSPAADLLGYDFVAVAMSGGWAAADITFQTSRDGIQFHDVYDDAPTPVEVALGAGAFSWVQIPSTLFRQFGRFVKIRSGTSGTPVTQFDNRRLYAIGRSD